MTKRPHALSIAQAAQALMAARGRWLKPAELVLRAPEIVPSCPGPTAAKGRVAGRGASRLGRGRRRCLWLARLPVR